MQIIGGQFRSRKLKSPKGMRTRPTASRVREALFNSIQIYVEDARVLDLFSGSGALGLEAISRGAASVTFVEKDPFALQALKENIAMLDVKKQCQVVAGDVFKWIRQQRNPAFDLILADPPYAIAEGRSQSSLATALADVIDENMQLLRPEGLLFIEAGENLPEEHQNYNTLVFKKERRYGRSRIRHYLAVGD